MRLDLVWTREVLFSVLFALSILDMAASRAAQFLLPPSLLSLPAAYCDCCGPQPSDSICLDEVMETCDNEITALFCPVPDNQSGSRASTKKVTPHVPISTPSLSAKRSVKRKPAASIATRYQTCCYCCMGHKDACEHNHMEQDDCNRPDIFNFCCGYGLNKYRTWI